MKERSMNNNTRNRKVKYAVGAACGNWTVLELRKHVVLVGAREVRRTDFLCSCRCGKTVLLSHSRLQHTKSCGCITGTHGFARQCNKHPVYLAWQGMMTRCYNPRRGQWKDYGGRGIKVCAAWHKVTKFIEDMLPSWKPRLTLDRKDNEKDYSAENCQWLTKAEQQRNKRNSCMINTPGGRLCVTEAARRYGAVSANAILYRLRHGWAEDKALLTPRHPKRTGRPRKPQEVER